MTFENGLVNLIDAGSIEQLARLVTRMEESPAVTVVVFDSANPEYFMAHWDLGADRARVAAIAPSTAAANDGLTWPDEPSELQEIPVT